MMYHIYMVSVPFRGYVVVISTLKSECPTRQVSVPFRGYVVVIPVPATRWGNYVPAAICGANRRRSILDVTVNSNHDVF